MSIIAHLAKFGGVGLFATAAHIGVAFAFSVLGAAPLVANFAGFCAAVLISYFGHGRLTFAVDLNHADHGPRFLVTALISLLASSGITWLFTVHWRAPFWLTLGIIGLLIPAFNYVLMRLWVFVPRRVSAADEWWATIVALVPGLGLIALQWNRAVHHDVAWYLVATAKWLDGASLYQDIIEVNPPLAFYLTVPAVLLSRVADITLANAHFVWVAALFALSLRLSWTVVRASGALSLRQTALFLALCAAIIVAAGIKDVGQRDHLMVLLVLPWLMQQALLPTAHPIGGNIARAILAGVGICLKPYFLALPAFVLLFRVLQDRSWRPLVAPSNLAMMAVGVGYVSYVWAVHPAYFTDIVPLARLVYGAYSMGSGRVWLTAAPRILAFALAVTLCVKEAAPARLFAIAALAGLCSYLMQFTGFRYQIIPFACFTGICLAWTLISRFQFGRPWGIAALALGISILNGAVLGIYNGAPAKELAGLIAPARSMTAYSSDLVPGAPTALVANAEWANRYPALWLVPGVVNERLTLDCNRYTERCRAQDDALERTRRDVADDLAHYRPDVIVFDRRSPFMPSRFDWRAFLSQSPRVVAELQNYRLSRRTERYEIWRRNP